MSEDVGDRQALLAYLRCESAAPASVVVGCSHMLEMYLEKLMQEQGAQVKRGGVTSEVALILVQHIRYTVHHFRAVLVTEIFVHPDLADMTVRFSLEEAHDWLTALDPQLGALSKFGDALIQGNVPSVVLDTLASEVTPQLAHDMFDRLPEAIQRLKTLLQVPYDTMEESV